MNGGNNLRETLAQPFEICPICVRKLLKVLKFDVKQRLLNLKKILNGNDPFYFNYEIEWFSKRIAYLETQIEE
jgi:hypothetical protein